MTRSAAQDLHFLGSGGIQLHRAMAGNYPRIPGITPGLGLVHDPLLPATRRLALPVQSGRLAPLLGLQQGRATSNMSQFRWRHARRRRVLLKRPAGLMIAVDDPVGRSHRPRARAPSRQQRCEVQFDGPIQFAFAHPLPPPIPEPRRAVRRGSGFSWASHLAAGHVSDTPATGGSDAVGCVRQ
jgi:hypothetical protein